MTTAAATPTEDSAPIWRCGVSDTISAVDLMLAAWRKSRKRSRREAAAELDPILQEIHDARMLRSPETYAAAYDAGGVLRNAAASAIEARSDATTKIGAAEGESAVPQADAQPSGPILPNKERPR